MDKLTSLLLLSAAHDDQGIYPASVTQDGVETGRTPWQDGWNSAVMSLAKNWVNLKNWFNTLPESKRILLAKLLTEGVAEFSINKDGAGGGCDVHILISMNDTFGYSVADAEEVPVAHLDIVAQLWSEFGGEGLTAYAAAKRNQDPIKTRINETYLLARGAARQILQCQPI